MSSYGFNVALKTIQLQGTLAWEYNPFRNYRLDQDMFYYKGKFWSVEGFNYPTDPNETKPILYLKGLLVDFITEDFNFDLNHPVLITPVYSYDNSVDLIINDGKTPPKIINSRFSAVGKNLYLIVDRVGNNDTNIYDKGELFKIDTSLYKITTKIPEIKFGGESYGGNLKIGNYHFYFKYSDLDGNESDFVALSGLVSMFKGNTPNSINSGFRDQNSNKRVRFILSNIDRSYDYIIVYYTRATSEEFLNRTTEYFKIDLKYKVSLNNHTIVDITGFENVIPSTFEEINEKLQIYDSAKSLAVSLNMLFLANTTLSNENHDILTRLALYIYPTLDTSVTCEVNTLSDSYKGTTTNTYYNSNFIYNYTGYWEDEIYRFGVVFIRTNNTLTPVYNIRGIHLSNKVEISYDDDKKVSYDETTFKIDSDFICSREHIELENAKGVCYIPFLKNLDTVLGINFKCPNAVIEKLKTLEIKGFFIVRQKRIPTTLCQAYTIGLELESHLPMLNVDENYKYESFINEEENKYVYWDEDGKKKYKWGNLLTHEYEEHLRTAQTGTIIPAAAICPDYDVNSPYLNNLFSGGDFVAINRYSTPTNLKLSSVNPRLYVANNSSLLDENSVKYQDVKIIGVEDDVKLVGINNTLFSARGGEAEEAFRYANVGSKVTQDHGGTNLVRGSFGPYLGITGYSHSGELITIKIPGYRTANMEDYFNIRYNDCSPFYPISNRLTFDDSNIIIRYGSFRLYNLGTFYRGDCYICKFTHRLNRNFRSPSTPTNDSIIDPKCWTHNMNFEDEVLKKEDLDKINLGDVNAVNLGQWVTITVRSNINHSVRSINESMPDEAVLIGNVRGFFPYHPISAQSAYKLPESGTYNKGFEASVGEQVFYELPNIPYYKDVFSTRIAYSNLLITSAFKNAYRVFLSSHYRDYPITYGEITKIVEWDGDIICILEHGIYRIPINERAVAGEGSGGTVFINTSNVLPENPLVISDTFGSLWIDSIIKTSTGIYGVDTVAKKIWKVDNSGIEVISDFKVQEFLNNNISLTERELTPIIGVRNVKTHYNAFKHDVMFTFYDDIHGLDEIAWNLCWNELLNKWITFYSWMPSFSENISNLYFSFDRNTSKEIAKIGLNEYSLQNDYIYIDNAIIEGQEIGKLHYDIIADGATVNYKWEILKDVNNNYTRFALSDPNTATPTLLATGSDYVIEHENTIVYDGITYIYEGGKWYLRRFGDPVNPTILITSKTLIAVLNREREAAWRRLLENPPKGKQRTYILNIRVTPTITYTGTNATYTEYVTTKNVNALLTGGYIDRTIAVIPKEHLAGLSSDFWKHGLAGLIDITEDVKPTNWYGKQHPFEFEFIVREAPDTHKIFDNLIIISNKAEPESFHYEVIGECYDFAKDKKNMYIRQEATKELFQNNGENISYNENYKELIEKHRLLNEAKRLFEKSTIFPAYYQRKDLLNTIEDYYHQRDNENGKDFSQWSGSEIVYYKKLNEFRIWNHSKGVNLKDHGLLRGNMLYKEDRWDVQIPSINLILCNEPDWSETDFETTGYSNKIPIELKHANFVNATELDTSSLKDRGIVLWKDNKVKFSEAKLKDKYIKIRVRYSGKDLAIISAIKTLFSISYA